MEARGLLVRDAGGFVLKSDGGGVWRLRLHRTPVDHVEKQVVVAGSAEGDMIEVERIGPA